MNSKDGSNQILKRYGLINNDMIGRKRIVFRKKKAVKEYIKEKINKRTAYPYLNERAESEWKESEKMLEQGKEENALINRKVEREGLNNQYVSTSSCSPNSYSSDINYNYSYSNSSGATNVDSFGTKMPMSHYQNNYVGSLFNNNYNNCNNYTQINNNLSEIINIDDDLLPNPSLISMLLADTNIKTNTNIGSLNNNNFNNLTLKNQKSASSLTAATQKNPCLIKEIRKICFKHMKKIKPEPEDLEFINRYKSKKALFDYENQQKFSEWKYNEEKFNSNFQQQLSNIKITKTVKKFKECSICLHEFKDNEDIKQINICSHIFHKECLDRWLGYNKFCPLDKTRLDY